MDAATRNWHEFASSETLALALSGAVAKVLSDAIAANGKATLAVSGGTTPGLFFRTLSREKLDWAKVTVTLIDERFVPADSPRSNAGLVASNLLQNEAAAANFVAPMIPSPAVRCLLMPRSSAWAATVTRPRSFPMPAI